MRKTDVTRLSSSALYDKASMEKKKTKKEQAGMGGVIYVENLQTGGCISRHEYKINSRHLKIKFQKSSLSSASCNILLSVIMKYAVTAYINISATNSLIFKKGGRQYRQGVIQTLHHQYTGGRESHLNSIYDTDMTENEEERTPLLFFSRKLQ